MSTLEYMKKYAYYYIYAIAVTLALNCMINGSARYVSSVQDTTDRPVIVIDAGHGGIDGGTTSCTGVLESGINLDIAKRLNWVFRLLGYETVMTRTTADSVATEGETIREQKRSDLKNRVETVEQAGNAILLSIHQNYYPESRYYGPQVFYTPEAKELADSLQKTLNNLTKNQSRTSRRSEGIYLMEHISVPGVLIECGFLSNPMEEGKLRQPEYQKGLCAVLACATAQYVESSGIS